MKDEDIQELHTIMTDWAMSKGYNSTHLLAFLSATFACSMEMTGYSQEFMDQTCDRMKENFRSERKNNRMDKDKR
jgi:hypothetical protein